MPDTEERPGILRDDEELVDQGPPAPIGDIPFAPDYRGTQDNSPSQARRFMGFQKYDSLVAAGATPAEAFRLAGADLLYQDPNEMAVKRSLKSDVAPTQRGLFMTKTGTAFYRPEGGSTVEPPPIAPPAELPQRPPGIAGDMLPESERGTFRDLGEVPQESTDQFEARQIKEMKPLDRAKLDQANSQTQGDKIFRDTIAAGPQEGESQEALTRRASLAASPFWIAANPKLSSTLINTTKGGTASPTPTADVTTKVVDGVTYYWTGHGWSHARSGANSGLSPEATERLRQSRAEENDIRKSLREAINNNALPEVVSKLQADLAAATQRSIALVQPKASALAESPAKTTTKALTVDQARALVAEAGGDKNKARDLARKRGYTF